MQTAFPSVAALGAGQSATATLIQTGNGWQVQSVSPASSVNQPQ
jgi:hypothetical protein